MSTMAQPVVTALVIVTSMSLAGFAHVFWLRSASSQRFSKPLDAGLHFRGRRLFGDNKQWRAFIVLPLASMGAFVLLRALAGPLPGHEGFLSIVSTAVLGMACGLGFLLAELPNSFIKRQLGIEPGAESIKPWQRITFNVIDRFDSSIGVLIIAALIVPMSLATVVWALLLGSLLHAFFSWLLHLLGVKQRRL